MCAICFDRQDLSIEDRLGEDLTDEEILAAILDMYKAHVVLHVASMIAPLMAL